MWFGHACNHIQIVGLKSVNQSTPRPRLAIECYECFAFNILLHGLVATSITEILLLLATILMENL